MARIAVVCRGDAGRDEAAIRTSRLGPVLDALEHVGIATEVILYSEASTNAVRKRLDDVDGALVWVDPIRGSEDRTTLDTLLRDIASTGVWVSAHPDIILKMGTKDVLYETRTLGWGSDTDRYLSLDELRERLPLRLQAGGARVLKLHRGNGGIGVQKLELIRPHAPIEESVVRVQSARLRDEATEDIPLREFLRRCEKYFTYADRTGHLIDQPFQPRITEGIIRCYLVQDEVVGFARQYPTNPPSVTNADAAISRHIFGLPSHKTMYPPEEPGLQALRTRVESEWVPGMRSLLDIDAQSLPALWDADFLLGPTTPEGDNTYVLCEINVSAVLPFPPQTPPKLAASVDAAMRATRDRPAAS